MSASWERGHASVRRSAADRRACLPRIQSVITSYSIHYTKLYEVEDGDGTAPEGNNVTAKAPTKAPTKMPGNTGGGDGAPVTPKPEKDANSNSLTNQEQEMFNLVNQARSQNNVPALAIDMELTKVV